MASRPFCSFCSLLHLFVRPLPPDKKKKKKNQIQTTGTGPASPNMEKTPATQLVEKNKKKTLIVTS